MIGKQNIPSLSRDAAEIESILSICRGCEFYTKTDRPRCTQCGCSVNKSPNGLKNIIAQAAEHYPLEPPKRQWQV